MFGLMLESTHEAAIAARDEKTKLALADLARMTIDRDNVRDSRDMAYRRCTHLEAEVAKLERDIAGLVPDAEKHRRSVEIGRRNLKQFRKGHLDGSAGIAAVGGV